MWTPYTLRSVLMVFVDQGDAGGIRSFGCKGREMLRTIKFKIDPESLDYPERKYHCSLQWCCSLLTGRLGFFFKRKINKTKLVCLNQKANRMIVPLEIVKFWYLWVWRKLTFYKKFSRGYWFMGDSVYVYIICFICLLACLLSLDS